MQCTFLRSTTQANTVQLLHTPHTKLGCFSFLCVIGLCVFAHLGVWCGKSFVCLLVCVCMCVCGCVCVHVGMCSCMCLQEQAVKCVCVCVRCFWTDRDQPTVKTAFFHTANQSSLQLGHSLSSAALYFLSPNLSLSTEIWPGSISSLVILCLPVL